MRIFMGQKETVYCPKDNGLAVDTLKIDGKGKILVIDSGGNENDAFLGLKKGKAPLTSL
jgi:regulator of RNase E activity RraA